MRPKRIVVIGSTHPDYEQYCPHWLGIQAGLKRLGIPFAFISCRPDLNLNKVVAFDPDLIIYGLKDMVAKKEWRAQLRERLPKAKIVIWYGDLRNAKTTQIDADCSEVDAMFVSNNAQEGFYQAKWKVKHVFYLPLGSEPLRQPSYNAKFAFPFVFIGSQLTDGFFIKRASEIENFKLQGKLTVINSFEPDMRRKIYQAMPAIYSSSKVCLDISHFTQIAGYTSIRFFEIPAFFGFALTKYFPGCEDLYPADTRVYFDTLEEALKLKDYYFKHETERRDILEKAHAWSYRHSYDKRFTAMFEML